ncbi:MAG: ferredoxin [Desulfotalea sp.]
MPKKKRPERFPLIDLGKCSDCRGCHEVAPEVFYYNHHTGFMDVAHLEEYPEELVDEAIKNCPKDCINWDK